MPHISFSELKDWNKCPFYHKLTHIEKLKKFKGNEYTAFGTAIHDTCEKKLLQEQTNSTEYFVERFKIALDKLPGELQLNQKLVEEMFDQGRNLAPHAIPALKEHFGEFELISTEENLFEVIDDFKEAHYDFKGFVDLVIQTSDGKYHIIDWKTCSWGWDRQRKNDRMTTYQLTFYKMFWAKKHNIDPENIETHFALLKRTAKNNNVEIYRVTSGNKKIQNAVNLLTKALYNINKNNHIKNRLACRDRWGPCEFYNTPLCT